MRLSVMVSALVLAAAVPLHAQDSTHVGNEYRITFFPSHRLKGSLIGFGYLGLVMNPDKQVTSYYLGIPGLIYKPARSVELWSGLISIYNDNKATENSYELRPFVGVKLFVPNAARVNLYNLTRLEYRSITQTESHTTRTFFRLRDRIGAEFPLAAHPFAPKSFYGLTDLEGIYRTDKGIVDIVRWRAGAGYVLSPKWRAEFIYHTQLTRNQPGEPLVWTDNIWRLNIKFFAERGLLDLFHGNTDFDPE